MSSPALAPLREGDRLNTGEFLRRWEAMPGLKYAELMNGAVFCIPSPVGMLHGSVHFDLGSWAGAYVDKDSRHIRRH